jgi:hypothetical protein
MDVRILYEALTRTEGVTGVTVEMPLKKLTSAPVELEEDGDDARPVLVTDEATAAPLRQPKGRKRKAAPEPPGMREMRFDVFFMYKGELCAIEVDDASHSTTPKRDATKNLITLGLGVHLLRVLALTMRTNAAARLEVMLRAFLQKIKGRRLQKPPPQDLKTWLLKRHTTLLKTHGTTPITTNDLSSKGTMPVYMMGSCDVRTFRISTEDELVTTMIEAAADQTRALMATALPWPLLVNDLCVTTTADMWSRINTAFSPTTPQIPQATADNPWAGHLLTLAPPYPSSAMLTGRVVVYNVAQGKVVARPLDAPRAEIVESAGWTTEALCKAVHTGDCMMWAVRTAGSTAPAAGPAIPCVSDTAPPMYPKASFADRAHHDYPLALLGNPALYDGMTLRYNGRDGTVRGARLDQGRVESEGDWSVYVATPELERWNLQSVVPHYELGDRVARARVITPTRIGRTRRRI